MKITLLTHAREFERPTNTGQLVTACQGVEIERQLWQRNQPDEKWLAQLTASDTVLVYPRDDAQPVDFTRPYRNLILLDATWQEARKIYNRSPYLQGLSAWRLDNLPTSQYRLRRNQQAGELCTAEVVIALLRSASLNQQADSLQLRFDAFNQAGR